MEPLLETLTLAPAAQLFELDPPRYTSSYGRRTEAIFKNNVPPAPMLISPDNGIILYERVISTKTEHQLLDKLTKPKYYHPTPQIKKSERKAFQHTAIGAHTGSSDPPRPSSAHCAPSSPHSGQGGDPGSSSRSTMSTASLASALSCRTGSGLSTPPQSPHHSRCHSAGRSMGTAGSGPGSGSGHGHGVRRKPLYPDNGPLKDYFSKERASVTATTVFTWGNRYKIGDCGVGRVVGAGTWTGGRGAGGPDTTVFTSYAPLQQKPPLRL